MNYEAAMTLVVVGVAMTLLVQNKLSGDLVLIGSAVMLVVTNVLDLSDAIDAFTHPVLIALGALYLVVAGLKQTGVLNLISNIVEARKNKPGHWWALMAPTAFASSFVNNTPIVATLTPAISQLHRHQPTGAGAYLMPVSFAAMLGGTLTLIGTSSNLVVSGLLFSTTGIEMNLFDVAWVGLPLAVTGLVALRLLAPRLLTTRQSDPLEEDRFFSSVSRYLVMPGGPMDGVTVLDAGLRNLPNGFVVELERGGEVFPAISPDRKLYGNDILMVAGSDKDDASINAMHGLRRVDEHITTERITATRMIVRASIHPESEFVGKTLKSISFRKRFGAVALGITRAGKPVHEKFGEVRLHEGDVLTLEPRPSFFERVRDGGDLLLLDREPNTNPIQPRGWFAVAIMLAFIVALATGFMRFEIAALIAAFGMLASGCVRWSDAKKSVDVSVLGMLGGAFVLAEALTQSGLVTSFRSALGQGIELEGAALIGVLFLLTSGVSHVVSNAAAAVLILPLGIDLAESANADPVGIAVTIMIAASASFATPIGYQTNLMVMGPGGYSFVDYVKLGLPLVIIAFLMTILIVPMKWAV